MGIILGWRPSRKVGATALAVPLLSVGVLAWLFGNPFNGTVFLIFAIILAIIGSRLPKEGTPKAPLWAVIAGSLMIVFGWVYPHFLGEGSWFRYLYSAPSGLIPCPTLCFTIGLALLANGFASRFWSIALVIIGVLYSLFGALRLGVRIDLILLAGALLLLVLILAQKRATHLGV